MPFGARNHDSELLTPPAGREVDDGICETPDSPTVISSNPLNLEADLPAPEVEITREMPSTSACALPSTNTYQPTRGDLAQDGSQGSSRSGDRAADFVKAPLSDQQTVISKRPPILEERLDPPFTPHELGQALVGKQLAHFQLEEFLGGGMGAVFLGRDLTLGRSVAVKVLPRGQDEDTLRRFKNEAQSAARLNHENIARVYYIGEENGWNFIIFEYIEGMNIRSLVDQRGPLSLDAAANHTLQAAEALDHAYRRDVVHRDIKPSNLIVANDGGTKLVDMGLARLHQVETSRDDLTASGVTLGTFDYISPEQACDPRTADVRSDIYSLGCTLYFMLTGRPPFPEGTVLQKLLYHQSRQPPDVRVFRPDLPDAAVSVINRMLAKRPEDRHQTPGELIADLLLLAEQLGLPSVGSRKMVVAPAPRRAMLEHHLFWAAPTVLLIAAVFLCEWWLRPPASDAEFSFPPVVARAVAGVGEQFSPSSADADFENEAWAAAENETESSTNDTPVGPAAASSTDNAGSPASEVRQPPTRVKEASDPSLGAPSPRVLALPNTPTSEGAGEASLTGTPSARTKSPDSPSPRASSLRTASAAGNGASAASAAPPASTSMAPVSRVVVGGSKDNLKPGDEWTATADEVFRNLSDAKKWPDLREIELRFNGKQPILPFVLRRKQLTIRAGDGYTPVLAFEDQDAYLHDRRMITLQGCELTLQGVQVRWRMPVDRTPYQWALLLLDDAQRLTLERCVLTIENIDHDLPQQNGAAFLRLESSTINQHAMQGKPAPPTTEIHLSECIFRGQADLIAAKESQPFDLTWREGLLVTTEQLVDINGSAMERAGSVSLALDHVTVAAKEGLCLLSSSEQTPNQLFLDVHATNCVFATDADAPLIEHKTHDEIAQLEMSSAWGKLLRWTGANNVRLEGEIVWRIDEPTQLPLDFRPVDHVWANVIGGDSFANDSLAWRSLEPSTGGVHSITKDSYLLRTSSEPPPTDIPGFNRLLLPHEASEPAN